MSYFRAPKQRNIYDYFNQIRDIESKVIPNNIPDKQYLAYMQNRLIFDPLFDRNVNISVTVENVTDSATDIIVNPGYVIMDYILIHQTQPVTLTVDKSFVVDNNYIIIVFATYQFNLEEPVESPVDYQLGLVLFDTNTNDLVSTTDYSDQAYDLYMNSQNKLHLKFLHLTYDSETNTYNDDDSISEITFSNGDTISTVPNPDNNLILSYDNLSWNFGYYN